MWKCDFEIGMENRQGIREEKAFTTLRSWSVLVRNSYAVPKRQQRFENENRYQPDPYKFWFIMPQRGPPPKIQFTSTKSGPVTGPQNTIPNSTGLRSERRIHFNFTSWTLMFGVYNDQIMKLEYLHGLQSFSVIR